MMHQNDVIEESLTLESGAFEQKLIAVSRVGITSMFLTGVVRYARQQIPTPCTGLASFPHIFITIMYYIIKVILASGSSKLRVARLSKK